MTINVFDEKGNKLNVEELDFNLGALYKENGAYIYKPFSEKQLAQHKIEENERLLEETNPIAIQYADGEISDEEYVSTKTERKLLRDEINELKKKL